MKRAVGGGDPLLFDSDVEGDLELSGGWGMHCGPGNLRMLDHNRFEPYKLMTNDVPGHRTSPPGSQPSMLSADPSLQSRTSGAAATPSYPLATVDRTGRESMAWNWRGNIAGNGRGSVMDSSREPGKGRTTLNSGSAAWELVERWGGIELLQTWGWVVRVALGG